MDFILASLDIALDGVKHGPAFATPELERYLVEESHRRMKLIESAEMETYPAEEVFARLEPQG